MVQLLGLFASTAGGQSLIFGQGTKIPNAVQHGQKKNVFKFILKDAFPCIKTAGVHVCVRCFWNKSELKSCGF